MCHLSTIKVKYVITADGITQITAVQTKKDNPALLTPLVVALTKVFAFPQETFGFFFEAESEIAPYTLKDIWCPKP